MYVAVSARPSYFFRSLELRPNEVDVLNKGSVFGNVTAKFINILFC